MPCKMALLDAYARAQIDTADTSSSSLNANLEYCVSLHIS